MAGHRMDRTHDVPREAEHSQEVLRQAGYADADIQRLVAQGVVRLPDPS